MDIEKLNEAIRTIKSYCSQHEDCPWCLFRVWNNYEGHYQCIVQDCPEGWLEVDDGKAD